MIFILFQVDEFSGSNREKLEEKVNAHKWIWGNSSSTV